MLHELLDIVLFMVWSICSVQQIMDLIVHKKTAFKDLGQIFQNRQ